MSELALQLIAQAKKDKVTSLNLGRCGLSQMPEELFELEWLEELSLQNRYWDFEKSKWILGNNGGEHNQFVQLDKNISKLSKLKRLYLTEFEISDLQPLEKLENLELLDLRSNQIGDISPLAKLTKLQHLYLSSNQISDIETLEQLTELEYLYLSNNQVKDIAVLEKLGKLQNLYLSSNQIDSFEVLQKLQDLEVLDIRSTQITKLDFLDNATNLQSLYLSSNPISDYSTLEKLTNLRSLYLRHNKITDYNFLQKQTQLRALYLSYSKIGDIRFLEALTNLEILDLGSNKIKDIEPLTKLKELQAIDLRSNQIEDLSPLKKLSKLRSLDLRSNQIKDIQGIKSLTKLQSLDLSSNQISNIQGLGQLTNLESLDLRSNQISDISALGKLHKMQSLNLSSNEISDIQVLANLKELLALHLTSNRIVDISVVEKLSKLQSLNLGSNKIWDIHQLKNLTNLQSLNLNSNEIIEIHYLENLIHLHSLDLRSNHISHLGKWITQWNRPVLLNAKPHSNGINLHNNPIDSPPIEVVMKGNEAIARYFDELDKGIDYLYEAKVLLVGESEAGKTSLLRKLENPENTLPEKEERTRGIDIVQLSFQGRREQEIKMNIWDFGGQEIYHATHRFFLTHRSLYVLLADTSRKEDNFDYWIPNIHLLGGESPILAVKNRKYGYDRDIGIGRFRKNEKFNIKDRVLEVDLKSNHGLEALKEKIFFQVESLPQMGSEIPSSWVGIREDIEALAKEHQLQYVDYQHFIDVCSVNGITDPLKISDLCKYFHDLGIVLWYHNIDLLRTKVILVPGWATSAVYKIVDDKAVIGRHGHFTKKDIKRLWTDEKYKGMHEELLAIMKAFKLCYQKRNQQAYIIPSLLQDDPQELDWDSQNNLQLHYQYEFMPKGLVNQLTADLSRLIPSDKHVWGRGVILENELSAGRVEEDRNKRMILISTRGIDARGMMTIISQEMEEIHSTFPGIEFSKQVPCPCKKCPVASKPTIFEYELLTQRLQEGKTKVFCNNLDKFLKINQLLLNVGISLEDDGDLEKPINAEPELKAPSKLKFFISYAKEDESQVNDFRRNCLAIFERGGKIEVWTNQNIFPGGEVDTMIKTQLNQADIILFMLSKNFINSDYIWHTEITNAVSRHQKGEVKIVPVLLEKCLWKDGLTPFSDLQPLPTNGVPIKDWKEEEDVSYVMSTELQELIKFCLQSPKSSTSR